MKSILTATIVIVLAIGCESPPVTPPPEAVAPAPSDSPITLEGKLLSGIVAIGAETTGWAIERALPEGGVERTEIDCAGVLEQAAALQGMPVRAHGRWEEREYIERGTMRVLIVDRVEAMP